MKAFITASLLALAATSPAFAQQAPSPQQEENTYLQQAANIDAQISALPGGGDERVREDLEWQALVARANADRVAMHAGLPTPVTQTGAAN